MTRLNRLVFIGNSLPRRGGIATFASDPRAAIDERAPDLERTIVAMNDHQRRYDYPEAVRHQIDGNRRDGLHPDRANENRGGESVLSRLLGLAEIRRFALLSEDRKFVAPLRVTHA